MRIDKDEIKRLADVIKINVSEEELDSIESSIAVITSKLDELLEIEVDSEPKFSGNLKENVFANEENEVDSAEIMKDVNNFDGEYVHVKKVIGDE